MIEKRNKLMKQRTILILLSCMIVFFSLIHVYSSWSKGSNLNHVSGAWTTLALDLTEGVFYRPLFSEETGYGGTRFFPLYFSLHALIILILGDPILSGCILTSAVSLMLLSGIFFLLKRSGAETWLAAVFTIFAIAGSSMQFGLTSIRGDILPIALNIWGLIFCSDVRKLRPFIAAIFFTLAFSAKITSVYGVFAVFLWLLLEGRLKEAWKLSVYTTIGILTVIAIMYIGSSGRVFNIMAVCSSGGASVRSILKSPLKLFYQLIDNDPALFCLFSLVILSSFTMTKKKLISLPVLYWLSALGITIFIFGSPGTASNHLVDLHIASILILAYHVIDKKFSGSKSSLKGSRGIAESHAFPAPKAEIAAIRRERSEAVFDLLKLNDRVQIIIFALIAVIFITPIAKGMSDASNPSRWKQIEAVTAFIDSQDHSEKPMLSENPFIPILAKEKVYLQDAFMFRLININDTSFAAPLYEKIDAIYFKTIVLLGNPALDIQWYKTLHFGEEFIRAVQKKYVFTKKIDKYNIYLPKTTTNISDLQKYEDKNNSIR